MVRLRKPAGAYHHGDLRDALLTEALKFIEQRGLVQLSLRELARHLGVSSAAPYHHFSNRTKLLEALVNRGFEELEACLREELSKVDASPIERLRALGRGYLKFAVKHPAHFRLMFRPDWLQGVPSGKPSLGGGAFELLGQVVITCLADAGREEADPMPSILAMWGGVHGIASLRLDGPLAVTDDPAEVDAFCESALMVLSQALTPGGPSPPSMGCAPGLSGPARFATDTRANRGKPIKA